MNEKELGKGPDTPWMWCDYRGGIIGTAIGRALGAATGCAWRCSKKRRKVGFGTSKANSGIIHAATMPIPEHPRAIEWSGNQRCREQLCGEIGFGFRRSGELTVARTENDVAELNRLYPGYEKKWTGLERDRARIRREEPQLSHEIIAAVYAPTTAVVNPYEACLGWRRMQSQMDCRCQPTVQSGR
ncbi:MAG: FAD-dependent oxidoreductase [Caldilineaceae bacterium]